MDFITSPSIDRPSHPPDLIDQTGSGASTENSICSSTSPFLHPSPPSISLQTLPTSEASEPGSALIIEQSTHDCPPISPQAQTTPPIPLFPESADSDSLVASPLRKKTCSLMDFIKPLSISIDSVSSPSCPSTIITRTTPFQEQFKRK